MTSQSKKALYENTFKHLRLLLEGETDEIAIFSTISCELYHAFDYFHWTGFYRVVEEELLKVGPYQGGHGCLSIHFDRGVCGACAREKRLINVPDVHAFPGHIACDSSTQSEIVVPFYDKNRALRAVLDIDSNHPAAFDEVDELYLAQLAEEISTRI